MAPPSHQINRSIQSSQAKHCSIHHHVAGCSGYLQMQDGQGPSASRTSEQIQQPTFPVHPACTEPLPGEINPMDTVPPACVQYHSTGMPIGIHRDLVQCNGWTDYQGFSSTDLYSYSPTVGVSIEESAINYANAEYIATEVATAYRGHHKAIDRGNYSGPLSCGWKGCTYADPFASLSCLWRHIQSMHISPEEYMCPHCFRTYGLSREEKYKLHLRGVHSDHSAWKR